MSEVIREFKECVFVDGILQNVGPWQYNYQDIYQGMDENGKPIFEKVAMNPFPENGVIEHRWFEYTVDRGWYEAGTEPVLGTVDQINRNLTDLYATLLRKNIILISDIPVYQEFDFKSKVIEIIEKENQGESS